MVTKILKAFFIVGALFFSYKAYAQPTFAIQNVKGACEGSPNGSFEVLVTSGTGTITVFSFGPPTQGPVVATVGVPVLISNLSGLATPGKPYLVVVQDDNGSDNTTVRILTFPIALGITIDNVQDNSDCLVSNGAISITPNGGSGAYTYSWVETTLGYTATTDDLTGLLGGNYVLTLGDQSTNCTRTFPPITVNNPSPVLYAITTPSPSIVCSGSDLSISLSGSEVGVSYQVIRNNVISTGISQVGTGAPLIFTVPFGTFANGDNFKIRATSGICNGDMSGVVIANIVPLPTASIAGTASICSGGSTNLTFTLPSPGTFNVVYTDGTTTFNANGISNGATVSVSPTANTTYTIVSVTNTTTNCTSTAPSPNITGSAVITVNPLPTASISGTATVCTGGTTQLTFALPAGTYNVVYTDGTTNFNANGIVNGAQVNVNPAVNTTYTIVSVSNTATTCTVSAPSPNITGSAVVTVNPLPTAQITGTTTICQGLNATLTFTLSAGTYDVVYTDGTTNFTASGIVNGATVSVSPTANTTYTIVSITNTSIASCTVTAPSPNITGSAVISVNPAPTASISGTTAICSGGTTNLVFTLPASGTYDVVYTDGSTNFNLTGISNGATVAVSPTSNTTYTIVSVTNTATSCSSIAPSANITGSAVVTVDQLPIASIDGDLTICLGGSSTLTFTLPAPGTFNVIFTDGTTNFTANGISNGATLSVSPTVNTTYTLVSVTNSVTGCVTTAPSPNLTGSAIVTVNPLPVASIDGDVTICEGQSSLLTFTLPPGTYDVVYTDGTATFNANGIASGATVSVSPTANTTYTIVSVTNLVTTCTSTAPSANITGSAVINVNALPTASISGTTTICLGQNTNLTFTLPSPGTFDVVYTDGTTNFNANGITNGATVNVGPTATTTYTIVSVTNTATTCTVTAPSTNITGSAVITVSPLPTASISGTATICEGNSTNLVFTLPAPGNFDVVFTDGTINFNANGITNGATFSVSPTSNTTYTIVSVTAGGSGCTVSAPSPNITGSAVITVNPVPTASISGSTTLCNGSNATLTFTLPATGTYDVVYTDGTTNFTATGIANGATVSVSPTATTTYTIVSVTNVATTCVSTAPTGNITGSAVITVNPSPTASISGTATICLGQSTILTFTLPAPGIFDVVYTDGMTNFNANGIANGATVSVSPTADLTYTIVSVTNTGTTCTTTAPSANITGSAVITLSPLPTADISGTATICEGNSTNLIFTLPAPGNFDVVFTDGTINFNANGITNGATFSVSPTSNTTYTIVSVTAGGSGCTVTAPNPNITGSAVITVNPVPVASISGSTTLCNGSNATLTFTLPATGTYDVVYTDGTTNFTANGIANGATVSVSPTSTTTYTIVSVTNIATTCVSTAPTGNITGSAVITVNPSPVASISGTATICVGQNTNLTFTLPTPGTFDVVYTDGTTNFNANGISNGAVVSVSPTADITYTIVSVTNTATSCTVTAPSTDITGSAVVTVTPLPTADISGTATICEGNSTNLVFTLPTPGNFDVVFTDGTINFTTNGITNGATFSVSPTGNTTYTIVSVTTAGSGCTVTAPSPNITGSAVITVNPSPTASISGTAVICQGDNATLTFNLPATGTFDVVYTDGTTNFNANGILNGATVSVSPAANTTYTIVSVTNTTTSCVSTAPSGNITGSADITVSPAPTASISGTATICLGNSTTLTFTLPVGTYDVVYTDGTTNFTANGIVTGASVSVSPTADISYTIVSVTNTTTSCSVTAPSGSITGSADITVIPTPTGSIAGTATICAGDAATLTFTLPAGTFDVVFTDGTTSFSATGIATGATVSVSPTANTTYTITSITNTATSCTVTAPDPGITGSAVITVTPSPTATISGTTSICSGSSTNITVTFTGTGPWSFQYSDGTTTSPVIPSFFNSITIPVSPTATTTYTLISAGDATVCPAVIGGSAVVTVNQNPLAGLTVGKTIDPLCSGGISDVTVATSELGVSYQLRNDAGNINIGTPVIGTGGTISLATGALTATTTFNVLATSAGCTPVELTTLVTVNVTGAINAALAVASDTNPVCSGSGANVVVSASENGVLYQLRNDADNSAVGATVPGTGGAISLPTGNLTATTTYNVLATNGTCSIELTDTETVTVGTAPDATLAVAVTIDPLCGGGITDITVALSQLGVTYQLRNDADDSNVGPAVAGTGGTIALPSGVLTANTTFNVLATAPGCSAIELTTLASVTVSGAVDATLAVTSAASPICEGTGTDIVVAASEAGVTYQLRDDATNTPVGAAVAGTGGSINLPTGNLTASTTFNVLASNGTCSIELTDTETVNVDVAPNASLAVNTTLNPLCVGGTSAVTIALSQTGVSYQLRDDADDSLIGSAVTGNGGTISLPTGVLNTTSVFNILATSGVCTPVELTNTATVTVAGTLDASLTVSSSAATICSGTSTFVIVQASEAGVQYQLRNDLDDSAIGAPVAGTGGNLNIPTGNLSTTTTFNVVANNGTCSIELSDTETITVTPSPTLSLSVAPASPLICPGNGTNIVVSGTQSGVSYQLRNNADNSPVGAAVVSTGGNILFPTGNLTATTTFNVFAGSGTCAAQLTNTATVNVRLAGDPACGGGPSDCANFSSIQPTIVTQPSCNDRDAGEVSFNISRADGTPTTFRVLWTINGNTQTKFTSSTTNFNDLSSGLYQYTIIDEGNGRSCGPVDFFLDLKTQVEIQNKQVTSNVTCFGGSDGNVILTVDGSTTGQYWYSYVLDGNESSAQTFTPGAPLPGGLPADDTDFIILKVDDNFNFTCPDTVMVRIRHTYPKIDFGVAATNVTTCNGTDGGIQVATIAGGDSGTEPLQIRLKKAVSFSVDPSGYVVAVDFENVAGGAKAYTGLSQGNYVVDVRDHLDCIQSKPIAVQAPGQVPLSSVTVTSADASCTNGGESGTIKVIISDAGIYKVAISQDQVNVPADADFIDYTSPSIPNVTFNNLASGAYYVYIKSNTTTCPTRTDAIFINGVQALADFDVLPNCGNVNLTLNNITGQQDASFVIRVFDNNDKFFKIDSLSSPNIPLSNSVTFTYAAPLQHVFLATPGTYRFVMIQNQTTGSGTCTLVSDTVVYQVRELLGITLGTVNPSFPEPKHTGAIEIANITGGTRFVTDQNELYYEISLTTADDDIVIIDWEQVKLDPQNRFIKLYEFLPPGVYRVKVRDAAGCVKTIDVEIPLDGSIYIPNIFTPNADNINDEFEILNLPVSGTSQLIITNRWGNEVFKSSDYREGNFWTAEETSDGIYFYRLKVDGGQVFTGWVEILRGSKP